MVGKHSYRRRRAGVAAAVAGAAIAALAAPGAASAAFTSAHCAGAPVAGAGATFQNPAQQAWASNLLWRSGAFCGSSAPAVSYQSVGSGAGRGSIGSHESTNTTGQRDFGAVGVTPGIVRYGASDTAANSTQRNDIQNGLSTTTADDALLHQVPITAGAVTIVVNYPDGCTVPSAGTQFDQPGANDNDHTGRFWADNDKLVRAFEGDASVDTWGELLGAANVVHSAANSKTDQQCQDTPIVRVVRQDNSGTSTVFKTWLQAVRGGGDTTDFLALGNQRWPNDTGSDFTVESSTFKRGNGNAGVASKVTSNDGAIGYVELADARGGGFDKTPNSAATTNGTATDDFDTTIGGDDKFWIRVKNGSAALQDPAVNSFKTGGTRGANCSNVKFTDTSVVGNPAGTLPAPPAGSTDPTLANWDKVNAANSTVEYGICTLTYALAFDDNALAYNASNGFSDATAEEARARTVKDYLEAIVSDQGQAIAASSDYAAMPSDVLTTARNGVAAINWNKAGTSSGGGGDTTGGGGNNTGGGGNNTGGGGGGNNTTPPPPTKPSNVFTISGARSASTGLITLPVNVPGAGTIKVTATTKIKVKKGHKNVHKNVAYGHVTVVTTAAGTVSLKLKASSAVKKALAKGQKLKVAVKVTFTPNGGDARTLPKTVTVKGKKPKKAGGK